METIISVRGTVHAVRIVELGSRQFCAFRLSDDRKGAFLVYARYEDVGHLDMEDGDHVSANGLEVADGVLLATNVDEWGRYCSVCGKWHTEGYYIDEMNYACSEECALHYYGGNRKEFEAELALLDDPETAYQACICWTEWD